MDSGMGTEVNRGIGAEMDRVGVPEPKVTLTINSNCEI